MHTLRRSRRNHVLVILAYLLVALVLTWPVAALFTTHVPGNGVDDPPLTWNLWWVKYALLDLGVNPFQCDYLFYPLGINLAFYTLTALNGLLSIPLQAGLAALGQAGGIVTASNLLLLSSFVLGAYGTFLLANYVLGPRDQSRVAGDVEPRPSLSPPDPARAGIRHRPHRAPGYLLQWAPFAAGLIYAFASSKLAYAALGQWNIASSQWIPFYVLYLCLMTEQPRQRRHALMAALFLLFQAYAELTYATFLALFTGLWLVWLALVRLRGRKVALLPLLVDLLLLGAVFLLGLAPMLAMMVPEMLVEGNFLVEGGGFADVFSADLLGYLVPTMYHPIFGGLVTRFGFDYSVGQHIYLGYSLLVLIILTGVWVPASRRRRADPRVRDGGSLGLGKSADGLPASPGTGREDTALRAALAAGPKPGPGPRPGVLFWLTSALFFWVLTLGPSLRINGHDTGIPLPFALVAQLPFFAGNRYPSRYSVMLFLSLAMVAGLGLAAILDRSERRQSWAMRGGRSRLLGICLAAMLVLGFLFEHLSIALPMSDMRVPPVYGTLAKEQKGDFTLLDLPVAWRNGFRVLGTQHTTIMFQQYDQSVHSKRILAGNTSRNPALTFQYFAEAPVINTLIALETGHPVEPLVLEQDRALAPEVLRFFNVQAVLVHPGQTGPDMVPYVESVLQAQRVDSDGEILRYRVSLPPWPEFWAIEPGDELGRLSYAQGWGVPSQGSIWAQRGSVRLLVPMSESGQALGDSAPAEGASPLAWRMIFRAYAPFSGQRLRLEANGRSVEEVEMVVGWADYEFALPAEVVQAGLNEIWLHFQAQYPANQLHVSPRAIGDTGVESPVNLVVESAGEEIGDFGHIYVDGQNVSPNGRGYNVAIIHPVTGEVEEVAVFDTHLDDGASQALAAFLGRVPEGHIVAVAAADEVSRLLGQEAVDALRGIGAIYDLQTRFRWGHAIIGVQGASPGSALEAADWIRPVRVVAGEGATEPRLAALFGTIVFKGAPSQ